MWLSFPFVLGAASHGFTAWMPSEDHTARNRAVGVKLEWRLALASFWAFVQCIVATNVEIDCKETRKEETRAVMLQYCSIAPAQYPYSEDYCCMVIIPDCFLGATIGGLKG